MTKEAFENRISNVTSRYAELVVLLKNLNCDQDTYDQILDYVNQSHSNEIRLIALIDKKECIDSVDVPDFLK